MFTLTLTQGIAGVASGSLVGFTLGLIGGGGSILAAPAMIYLVGVASPHVAIGTSAAAVAANALLALASHLRARTVKWRCAGVFAAMGVLGAALGSTLGLMIDGDKLLALFAVLMIVVGILTLRGRSALGRPDVVLGRDNAGRLAGTGLATGSLAGFFGIGGGFLVVPGLIFATGMPIINAVGSSLVAVSAFGLTTATNYAWAGLVDWPVAALFVVGGLIGSALGARAARGLAGKKGALNVVLAAIIVSVGIYILVRSLAGF
ncbi:MAG: sulfite exporter TauE/SafE family protein [Salinarimonadaceae bacterium]|nr:MAG: sulfite exporter TauE/SafE family protein [Salinarimonadaceae bacterium]